MSALAIAMVEIRRFLRDRSNLFFVFGFPILLVIFIGSQFSGDSAIQLGVIAPDDDLATRVVDTLAASENVEVTHYDDRQTLIDHVERTRLSGAVILESGFATGGDAAEVVTVLAPPGTAATTIEVLVAAAIAPASNHIGAVKHAADLLDVAPGDIASLHEVATQVAAQLASVTVEVETAGGDPLAQEFAALGQFDYGASTQLFLFIFLTSLTASAAVIQVRNLGIASRMLSTPISPRTLVFGLAGGRVGVAITQALYIVVATWLLFRVNWGDPLAAAVLIVVFCLLSAAAAVAFGSLFRNDAQAAGAGVGIGMVLAALGGSMAPIELFPESLQRVAMVTPHRWANAAMAELVRRDGSIGDIATELGVLLAYTAVLTVAAALLMRRALTR